MKEFAIQGYYDNDYGWEDLCIEENGRDAQAQLKCYDENEPKYRHRIKIREKRVVERRGGINE